MQYNLILRFVSGQRIEMLKQCAQGENKAKQKTAHSSHIGFGHICHQCINRKTKTRNEKKNNATTISIRGLNVKREMKTLSLYSNQIGKKNCGTCTSTIVWFVETRVLVVILLCFVTFAHTGSKQKWIYEDEKETQMMRREYSTIQCMRKNLIKIWIVFFSFIVFGCLGYSTT